MNANEINNQYVTIPLSPEAHEWAQEFAAAQGSSEKAKQVYLNTLAVYAVHTYLRWLQVETNLEASDSWNLAVNAFFDIADLELPDIGKLICCPVLPDEDSFTPPEIIPTDAIGHIAVQFKEVLNEVDLVGYRPILDSTTPPTEICLDLLESEAADDYCSLFPMENLLDWLFYIQDVRERIEEADESLIEGIRQILEEQWSPTQLTVQAVYTIQKYPESLWARYGEEILKGKDTSSEVVLKKSSQLRDFFGSSSEKETPIKEDEAEEKLKEVGGQFLRWVKQIVDEAA